ncbi:MAG TPA: hypothetical protein VFQ85_08045 [Mycobacteriales bacterium]|nr:hypothetical protein [Mycobacteriales bacterium]
MTPPAGRVLDAGLHLLDRQVVDRDGKHAGKVDDLELTVPDGGGAPYVTAILGGPAALAPRLGGLLGRWFLAVQRRLHSAEDPQPARIDFGDVAEVGSAVKVARDRGDLAVNAFEQWCRDNVIAKLPGAAHESE